jgi:ABC-2 type transport system ATP-binding protein
LKHRSLEGELLAVECSDVGRAIGMLQKAPGVRDAAVFGNALHVVVDDAARRADELTNLLAGEGMAGATAKRIEPSLEDSFVSLVAASSREHSQEEA